MWIRGPGTSSCRLGAGVALASDQDASSARRGRHGIAIHMAHMGGQAVPGVLVTAGYWQGDGMPVNPLCSSIRCPRRHVPGEDDPARGEAQPNLTIEFMGEY